jgi:hypothetical protein
MKYANEMTIMLNINIYHSSLPQPIMTNSDLGRLLKAFEIQSVLRAPMYVDLLQCIC